MDKTKVKPRLGTRDKVAKTEASWQEYERRKAVLRLLDLPAKDYEQHCKRIAKELGI